MFENVLDCSKTHVSCTNWTIFQPCRFEDFRVRGLIILSICFGFRVYTQKHFWVFMNIQTCLRELWKNQSIWLLFSEYSEKQARLGLFLNIWRYSEFCQSMVSFSKCGRTGLVRGAYPRGSAAGDMGPRRPSAGAGIVSPCGRGAPDLARLVGECNSTKCYWHNSQVNQKMAALHWCLQHGHSKLREGKKHT